MDIYIYLNKSKCCAKERNQGIEGCYKDNKIQSDLPMGASAQSCIIVQLAMVLHQPGGIEVGRTFFNNRGFHFQKDIQLRKVSVPYFKEQGLIWGEV